MSSWCLRGARILDPSCGRDEIADIAIENGRITAVGSDLVCSQAQERDVHGLICVPGLVDMHVHLRDPGQTHKEDIFTGCCAAAAGGVTSVVCMPNTLPPLDCAELIRAVADKAATAAAHVYPVGTITQELKGQALNDFAALKQAGAIAVSDDGRPVPTAELMEQALIQAAAVGLPVLAHCEDMALAAGGIMHAGEIAKRLGVRGIPREAEDVATAREIGLAAKTGCPVHICHVSTRGSVELLRRAQREGIPVTGETAPHYLMLTDEKLLSRDADYRMNPPLRTAYDVEAVREGVCDGTLSIIATDHAPHTAEEKADFDRAPNGVVGMETSLAAMITAMVVPGYLSLMDVIRLMSTAPAQRLGLAAGTLAVGAPADIVLFDPTETWQVVPQQLHGRSRNAVFKGQTLTGRVKATFCGGRLVYDSQMNL